MLPFKNFHFSGVKGIDELILSFDESRMNVFIGNNGVGKTKTLECLYLALLSTNQYIQKSELFSWINAEEILFKKCCIDNKINFEINNKEGCHIYELLNCSHNLPIAYISAKDRASIKTQKDSNPFLGEKKERQEKYFKQILNSLTKNKLDDTISIEEWIVQRANSAGKYQDSDDNREIELITLLSILHKIDGRIDDSVESLKIHGGHSVSILIDGQRRRLNELSSGFSSLVKIIQAIISCYGFFTNEIELDKVEGIILIDEIESHLHIEWQTKILPLLVKLLPNTTFIVTTHSSLVLAQMVEGKAYRLERINNCVINQPIKMPRSLALIDLVKEAFDVNLNQMKIDTESLKDQELAKKALLSLLER